MYNFPRTLTASPFQLKISRLRYLFLKTLGVFLCPVLRLTPASVWWKGKDQRTQISNPDLVSFLTCPPPPIGTQASWVVRPRSVGGGSVGRWGVGRPVSSPTNAASVQAE